MTTRWVRLYVPTSRFDMEIFGREPVVIGEAPKGVGREVRLATDAETGLWAYKALPPARLTA